MFDRPPMITSLLAAMNVSPIQASPRIPMTAVIPAWQVLVVTIFATGALVNDSISAAIPSMMMAIVMGMLMVIGAAAGAGFVAGTTTVGGAGGAGVVVGGSALSGSAGSAGNVAAVSGRSGSVASGTDAIATLASGAGVGSATCPTCRSRGNSPHSTTIITPARNIHADSAARGGSGASCAVVASSFSSPDASRPRYSGS